MSDQPVNILITGGSGFLGKSLLRELFSPESPLAPDRVRVYDLQDVPAEFQDRVEYIQGDVRNAEMLKAACDGMDIVLHLAAVVDWGVRPEEEIIDVNVGGTRNAIQACLRAGVRHLVHVSSLDAVYTGKPLVDIDESQAYPETFKTTYCKSKYLSEIAALEAHGDELRTVVLRPSDIYGEMDPYHVDSLVDMAKGGFYVRLGSGNSKCQHVYSGNMAHALLMAGSALLNGNSTIGGEVYFITDGEGTNFFKFFDQIVEGAGYRIWPANFWIPRPVAHFMGAASEFTAFLARPVKKYHPKFSRFAVVYTCTDFTFSSAKASRDFGFAPKYDHNTALQRTIDYYRKQRLAEEAGGDQP
jgi:nucleoside-diphosphate-sugar epimerase